MAAVSPVGRAAGLEPLEALDDSRAAAALYERHSRRVFAYCLSRLRRREDAEDAVQTTFLHAVRGLRRGVVPAVELAWLLGIARNVCLTRRESAGRRGRLELVCDPVDLERSAAPQGRRDELIGLEQALVRLPEQQRRAVLLRDWRGLSYEEVAEQLGVSLANAETLIFRGRRTLAELLREEPAATRRRLASLGNLGSLSTTIKTALTGGAAATKIAAAVTAVAVSAAGIAAGSSALSSRGEAPPPVDRAPRALGSAARATPVARPGARGAATTRTRGAVPPRTPPDDVGPRGAAPAGPPATAPGPLTASAAPAAAPPAPTPPPAGRTPAPAPAPAPLPEATKAVSTTASTVQGTVDEVAPELPATVPALPDGVGSPPAPPLPVETPPLAETVADAVPAVTVEPPPPVPLPPVTVDPATLLP